MTNNELYYVLLMQTVLSSFIMYLQCCYINQLSILHPKLVGCGYINPLYSLCYTCFVSNEQRVYYRQSIFMVVINLPQPAPGIGIVNVVMLEKVVVSYIMGLLTEVSCNVTHQTLAICVHRETGITNSVMQGNFRYSLCPKIVVMFLFVRDNLTDL